MRYEIIGRNGFTPTDAIKAYVEKRLDKIVNILNKKVIDHVRVVLRVYKEYSKVEVTIPAPYIILRSEVRDPDMYTAIDKSVDKLTAQIRKHQGKIKRHFEKRGQEVFNPDFDLEEMDKKVRARQLVKSKKFSIRPMSIDDAIAQMELSGHDFFIFLDEKTHNPQIVYEREDGDYAVIETTPELLK